MKSEFWENAFKLEQKEHLETKVKLEKIRDMVKFPITEGQGFITTIRKIREVLENEKEISN